jgi:formylglycine-generating enzyme required for sulfatase activity
LNHPVHDPRWGRAAIQHRDVKPQNVLIVGGAAQVCDYGLARALDDTRGTCSLSPAYAAPESFDGKVCAQTDQYSLAVTYVELRTGNLPFHDTSLMGILKAHRTGDLDLTKLTGPEQAVIKRATAANPDDRYPSCQAMVAALQEAMSQRPEPARKSAWLWVAASLLVVVPVALFAVQHWFPSVHVPAGFEADSGANAVRIGGTHYYDRISRVLPSGTRVPFVLVAQKPGSELRTFYIMETKVWNELFQEFASESPDALESDDWRRGAEAGGHDLGVENPRLPAVRMTAMEAHRFAEWLGGALPSTKQWDTAAGLYLDETGNGPFLSLASGEAPHIAVDRRTSGPLPVGEAPDDVSPFGCREMAGNGLEWTRTIDDNPSQELSNREIPNLVEDDLVVLRGRSYASARPLHYDDLRGRSEMQSNDEGSPEIGLRVVVVPEL